jgi:SAM-dependent methyltransferase
MTHAYTFGHTTSAAERLRILAGVYEAESEAFLRAYAPWRPAVAVDLGCGPGYTTTLVARTTAAARMFGLDVSEDFIAQAKRELGELAAFSVHDVTVPPFPCGAADLIFCRLLLTHLPAPAEAMAAWLSALAPGGRLLIDEVDAIDAPDSTCARYLEIAAGVIRSTGGDLYIGPKLGTMAPAGSRVISDRSEPYDVGIADAAAMFRLNLPNWAEKAIAGGLTTTDELGHIAEQMEAFAQGRRHGPALRWHMRHLVLEAPA